MAVNSATLQQGIAARQSRVAFEHRFFLTVAVLFPLIMIAGFAPSYYFRPFVNTPPLPSVLVHVHGAMMTAWMALYLVQTWLITSKQVKVHMTLGLFGVVLAIAVIGVGIATGIEAGIRGGTVPGFTPQQFLVVPIGDMLVFTVLFAAAIYYRKQSATHKRLMLLTVLNFLAPSLGRMHFASDALGPIWFWGVPYLAAIVFIVVDSVRNKKINVPFLAGTLLLIASGPARLALAQTEAWQNFARTLIG